jgi:hypothetical protein
VGGLGVLLLRLGGIASRLAGPDTVVGDGHFNEETKVVMEGFRADS